jgi:DNA-binding LacI/PurR family transcriptional regulator
MKKYSTLKDIARILNISAATVSRALSDHPNINSETKKLVLTEAKRQNYKPNFIAQKLQNRRTKTIGLVVPEFKTSFFPLIISGIQKEITEAGFQLLITDSMESGQIEVQNLKLLEKNMVEGILMSITSEDENSELYNEIINSGIPIVFFNRVPSNVIAPKVIIDDYKMAFFATEHLIYSGFKKIYHFCGPENILVTRERRRGFQDAIKKHQLPITENSITLAGIHMDKGYDAMKSLIEKNDIPEAVFCFNDPTALGAMKAIKEFGLRCPDDIAIVGFSETILAQLVDPSLTSIAQPCFEIGVTAARLLLEQINLTPPPVPETVCLRAELNIRKSSINIHKT